MKLSNYGKSLNTRDLAKSLFAKNNKSTLAVELDFEGVDAISPSFAHELIIAITTNNNKLVIKKANTNIKEQLKRAYNIVKTQDLK